MMELNQWGWPIFKAKYVGREEREGLIVFKFSKPAANISGVKTYTAKGYSVGFVSWFRNLYVDYIIIDRLIHPDMVGFLKNRLNEILAEARRNGWNKRHTAEAEAVAKLLESM